MNVRGGWCRGWMVGALVVYGACATAVEGDEAAEFGTAEEAATASDGKDGLVRPLLVRTATAGTAFPDRYNPSAFLYGSVAVGIILPESNGQMEPSLENWTTAEIQNATDQIRQATQWWAAREPRAKLSFVLETTVAATGYEAKEHGWSTESTWISDVMTRLGYPGSNHFEQVFAYEDALRKKHKTDWATVIFVADTSNSAAGRLADGRIAYAYINGPFVVSTSTVVLPMTLAGTVAHELGHIFGALDQYAAAAFPCDMKSGFLWVPNENSLDPYSRQQGLCASDVLSLMRDTLWPYTNGMLDAYARGQVGWRDSNKNGLLDPIDTTVSVAAAGVGASYTGAARDVPTPLGTAPITINKIVNVEYRVGSGAWTRATAADGAFDSDTEEFTFTLPQQTSSAVEVRATNSQGKQAVANATTTALPTNVFTVRSSTNLDGSTISYRTVGTTDVSTALGDGNASTYIALSTAASSNTFTHKAGFERRTFTSSVSAVAKVHYKCSTAGDSGTMVVRKGPVGSTSPSDFVTVPATFKNCDGVLHTVRLPVPNLLNLDQLAVTVTSAGKSMQIADIWMTLTQ